MAVQFPKDVADAMREVILAIFWPRQAIIDFLKSHNCTTRELDRARKNDGELLARAQIVDAVFDALRDRDDGGLGQFRSMLQSLVTWTQFDSYYFDKLKKLDRAEAVRRIQHLSQLQEIRDAQSREKLKRDSERLANASNSTESREKLKRTFLQLYQGKDASGQSVSTAERGYLFQDWLQAMCRLEGVEVTEPFQIVGEQIDGAIKYDGEHYLVEAKWQDKFVASSSLYQFAAKVEGKMYGRGVFFSINGYSGESIEALKVGKALKTVLFDGADCTLIAEGFIPFLRMLNEKVKCAQTMGRIYVDAATKQEKHL